MRGLILLLLMSLWSTEIARADTKYRGFQVGLPDIVEQDVKNLAEVWGINIARIQVGNHWEMNGTTGDDYFEMMNEVIETFDSKLPWFRKYDIKVVFSMYSPPGGFIEDTPELTKAAHHTMFSDPVLQDEFIKMWKIVAERYKNNDTVYAYDLLNEPADRKDLICKRCMAWPQLGKKIIKEVRKITKTKPIILKSSYGDPTKLSKLPIINDPNLIYGYHGYVFQAYQGSGLSEDRVERLPRPSYLKIQEKLYSLIGKFMLKMKRAASRGRFRHYPPRLNVGEFAVSSCAKSEPSRFLQDLLRVIERDDEKRQKRRRTRRKRTRIKKANNIRNQRRAAAQEAVHESWTNHAVFDHPVWDPRYVCDRFGNFTYKGATKRGLVLREYFLRNSTRR